MRVFNYLFLFIIIICFSLPSGSTFYLSLPGVQLSINELGFLLLTLINPLCKDSNNVKVVSKKTQNQIVLLLVLVLINEIFIKGIVFNTSIIESIKSIRVGIPVFCSLLLLWQSIRVDLKLLWKVLLCSILFSFLISIIALFIYLPIYKGLEAGDSVLVANAGRIVNSNASFGFIGLYLLLNDKKKWYNSGWLVKVASVVSVFALILAFNRTYLALLALELIFLLALKYSVKSVIVTLLSLACVVTFTVYLYDSNAYVKSQIDKRILAIVSGETTIKASTIDNNRDVIYEGIEEKLNQHHWLIGMSYDHFIFENYNREQRDYVKIRVTDTSIITFLLSYGIIPLIILMMIFVNMFKSGSYLYKTIFILLLVGSLNIDSLVRQNSVFYLILIFIITLYPSNEPLKLRANEPK